MREAQRARTRKEIVRATARLIECGEKPGLEEVAAEAQLSRATVYRYFPGFDALYSEAIVDALVPEPEAVLADGPADAPSRIALVDEAFDRAMRQGEVALRLMLARILERSATPGANEIPLRQNRRGPMIDMALEPLREHLGADETRLLSHALAMVIGTEGFLALNDVLGLDADEARRVRRWALEALLAAALKGKPGG